MNEPTHSELSRVFTVAVSVVVGAIALTLVPTDDGLRHVGLAFGSERGWGEVYPFSQFEVFGDYDPWGGYDRTLRAVAAGLAWLPIAPLLQQFIVLKVLSLGFVALLLALCLRRGRISDTLVDSHSLFLAIVLTGAALGPTIHRMGTIRPFAFGTFLLLYSVGQRGAIKGLLASGATCFFYPYLAWMYTGPVIVAHFLKGSRSFALGVLAATALSIGIQPASFWGLLEELIGSDAVREQIDSKIAEFAPVTESVPLVALIVMVMLWLWPRLPAQARRLRIEHVMLILFIPISVKYMRYLVDVWVPLLFVAHGADLLRCLRAPFANEISRWQSLRGSSSPAEGGASPEAAIPQTPRSRTPFRVGMALCCTFLLAVLVMGAANQQMDLAAIRPRLAPIPHGSLVITEFNLQYRLLYARSDLALVPSCELGFATENIRDAYIAFMNRGEVCELAEITGASFFVEGRGHYIDPAHAACLRLRSEDAELRIWNIDPAR